MTAALDARFVLTVGAGERCFRVEATLALEAGVLVLFGPSGVGKTLTLQALAGLITPSEGHIRAGDALLYDAASRVNVPAHERRVGFVPQQHALFPFLDVAGNVAFGLPRAERRGPRVRALLDELGLARLASANPSSLSGGERQRVALARALAVSPRLLLLDEPFASLDQEARAALRRTVREVIDRHGVPAVLVTHDAEEAVTLGDRLLRFSRGKTGEHGPPRALLAADRITLRGEREGAIEPAGEGRARAHLSAAVIEGPAEIVGAQTIDLDLSAR